MKIRATKTPEFIIYLFLWLIFLIIPLITNNYSVKGDFIRICYDWLKMLPFVIVFFINSLWLLPRLLFRGNTNKYLFVLLLTTLIVATTFQVIGPVLYKNDPKLLEQRILQDPQWGRGEMKPDASEHSPNNAPASPELFKPRSEDGFLQSRGIPTPNQSIFLFINTFLISLLVAGFNTAIAVTNRWFTEEQARKEIEKERIQSELSFLQNQVSPHFFMNTLNNIHALIDADQGLAQNAVLKLSEMMRYLLYDSGRGTTTLAKEIEFLMSYIKLMQLRVDESVKVNFEFPSEFSNVNIPPLLFISFIENAFKHGVSYMEPSSLSFKLVQEINSLEFIAVNSILGDHNDPAGGIGIHKGLGLENIKKRLKLLYGDKYQLIIGQTDHDFNVKLVIPT